MKKKILYCASVDYHFRAFHLPYMKWFQEQGWEVHVAARGDVELPYCNKKYNLSIERSPFKSANFKAYKELKKIIGHNQYNIIHAHTPMGGALIRLAAREARKRGTKVLYTAHGFHFCKGVPLLNWVIYYPLERWLAHYTDCLITINNEDYNLASKHNFKAESIEHVHGVGVDTVRFHPVSEGEKSRLRQKHGYRDCDYLLYYVAELNKNKNQGLLIKVVSKVREKVPHVRLLLVGDGGLMGDYKELARSLGADDIVDFVGFRKDVDEIAKMCDVAVASSLREGLPVNIMEAMACGKPIVAIENRGHRELVQDGVNGFIVKSKDESCFAEKLYELHQNSELGYKMSCNTVAEINSYAIKNVMEEMERVYVKFDVK